MSETIHITESEPRRVVAPEDWLFAALLAMVIEHCGTMAEEKLDSYQLKANEDAMRLLAQAGYIEIETEENERIKAKVLPAAHELMSLVKTG